MQERDGGYLRSAHGNKPCDHPNLEKEYFNGLQQVKVYALHCGNDRWGRDWNVKKRTVEKDG